MPLNEPWINPASIDYTDALNPLGNPGYSKNNNRFVYECLKDQTFQALANGLGIEGRLWVCPDPDNQTLAGLATTDFNVPSEPNTWLYAFNCVSNPGNAPDAASFLFQVIDSMTGAELFTQPTRADTYYASDPSQGVLHFTRPRLFVPPAYPIVRIINLSVNAQICLVNLFCAIETDVQPIP